MTDRKRLEEKLTKLATEASEIDGGWRRIGHNSQDPISAVVAEIDETIYPVKIGLRNAAGEVVSLAVGHRRLRCVLGELPETLGQFEAICGVELTDPPAGLLGRISDMLRTHAENGSFLWVQTTEVPNADIVAGGGVPAGKLADVWMIEALGKPGIDTAVAFDEFASELKAKSNSWLKLNGRQVVESSDGSSSNIDGLSDALDLVSSASNPDIRNDQMGAALVVHGAQSAWHRAIAQYNKTSYVAEISGAVAAELPALWRASGL